MTTQIHPNLLQSSSINAPVLQQGDNGTAVEQLQRLLNFRGASLAVDGAFGSKTRDRVVEFQQAIGLAPDGIVGSKTWAAVRSALLNSRQGSSINVRSQPSTDAQILEVNNSGDPVQLFGRTTESVQGYQWFQVQSRSGAIGWVREDLVMLQLPFTTTLPIVSDIVIQGRPRAGMSEPNVQIEESIRSVFMLGFRDRVRYLYQPIDIRSDGKPAAVIVYLFGKSVCGTGGCTGLVLKVTATGYQVITKMTNLSNPIIISNQRTHGFPNLITFTSGGGIPGAYRILQFDGITYPTNAADAPTVAPGSIISGVVAISNRISPDLAAPLVAV